MEVTSLSTADALSMVEAYRPNDSACHGRFGITPRTAPVFGPGGHACLSLLWSPHDAECCCWQGRSWSCCFACAPISGNRENELASGFRGNFVEFPAWVLWTMTLQV